MSIVSCFIWLSRRKKGRSDRDMAEPSRSTHLVVYPARSGNPQANRIG
jgi:hypothetical protein